MDSLITNQGALAAQMTETLKMDLDEWNIRGRYNIMRLVRFSSIAHIQLTK